jgi:hypothetical protein
MCVCVWGSEWFGLKRTCEETVAKAWSYPSGVNLTFDASRPVIGVWLISAALLSSYAVMKGGAVRPRRTLSRSGYEKAAPHSRGDRIGRVFPRPVAVAAGRHNPRRCSKTTSEPASGRPAATVFGYPAQSFIAHHLGGVVQAAANDHRASAEDCLDGTLKEVQLKRLRQVMLQRVGLLGLGHPEVTKELEITDKQRQQFMKFMQEMQKKMEPVMKEAQKGGKPEEIAPKLRKIRREQESKTRRSWTTPRKSSGRNCWASRWTWATESMRRPGSAGRGTIVFDLQELA